jgi:hypothetical protein
MGVWGGLTKKTCTQTQQQKKNDGVRQTASFSCVLMQSFYTEETAVHLMARVQRVRWKQADPGLDKLASLGGTRPKRFPRDVGQDFMGRVVVCVVAQKNDERMQTVLSNSSTTGVSSCVGAFWMG